MIDNPLLITITVLECIAVISVFDALFKRRLLGKFAYAITVITYIASAMLSSWLLYSSPWKWIIGILYFILISFILYEGKILVKIICSALIFVSLNLLDYLSAALLMLLSQISFETVVTIGYYSILGAILSKSVFYFFAKLFQHVRRWKPVSLRFSDWIWLSVMEVSLLYVMAHLVWNDISQGEVTVSTILSIICLIVMNIFLFYLVEKISERYMAQQQAALLEQQNRIEKRHMGEMDDAYQRIGKHLHDTKNHYPCLQGMVQGGDYPKARQYLMELINGMGAFPTQIKSGNLAFDSLMNPKLIVAKEKGIAFHLNLVGLEELQLSEVDFISLAGNLIDNAIEACEQFDQPTEIQVKVLQDKHKFVLSVSNPVKKDVAISNNVIKTSKADTKCHGYGLANIQNVLQKYGGDLQLSCEGKMFHAVAIIYK